MTTLMLSYTGYLLPWDQLAYWAITIGSSIVSAVPVIGNKLRFLMLGGNAVNGNALLRFYVLHCMILPLVAILLVAVHFWRIRKDGGLYDRQSELRDPVSGADSNAHKPRRASAQVKVAVEEYVLTIPEVLFRVAVAFEVLAIALIGMALVFNAPLEGIADPSYTPNPAKAPWYFLGLQEMLHYFPPVIAGALLPALVIFALTAIPYFKINIEEKGLFQKDRKRHLLIFYILTAGLLWRSLAAKPLSFWIMTWFLLELVVLTAVGTFFRGPGWSWVLPWRS
jgi:quinol-cytochrome oxidoreductase complex cytochrome b subunit